MNFKLVSIKNIEVKECKEKTYDLTVENDHSYNIQGIVVHNSACSTRRETGVGVPMITSIQDVVKTAQLHDIPVIADGGIRSAGDIAKALAAGADAVMIGSMFAGTQESPGDVYQDQKMYMYKVYRGSASFEAKHK